MGEVGGCRRMTRWKSSCAAEATVEASAAVQSLPKTEDRPSSNRM